MLAALAINWTLVLCRALLALAFGIAAVVWPGLTPLGVAYLFGAYALLDGGLAVSAALDVESSAGFTSLLFEALMRVAAGAIALFAPAMTVLAFPRVFGAWWVLSGLAALTVASALRDEFTGEWPLPLAGAVSVLLGVLLLTGAGAAFDLAWIVGYYLLFFGTMLLALALRLRQLAAEIQTTNHSV
jgi:uncharacterized membrane protein HdeD (DUF308 family)